MRWIPLLLLCLGIGTSTGLGQLPYDTPDASPLGMSDALTVGDEIQITVYDGNSLESEERQYGGLIGDDGQVVIPVVGKLIAVGKTASELEQELTTAFRKFMANPLVKVSVKGRTTERAALLGQCRRQGYHPLEENTTVSEFIAANGGFDINANLKKILVVRGEDGTVIQVDLKAYFEQGDTTQDILLENNDRVFVPIQKPSFLERATRVAGLLNLVLQVVVVILVING